MSVCGVRKFIDKVRTLQEESLGNFRGEFQTTISYS
jgi:hypothetical protein